MQLTEQLRKSQLTEDEKWAELCAWSHDMLAAAQNPKGMAIKMDTTLNMFFMEEVSGGWRI